MKTLLTTALLLAVLATNGYSQKTVHKYIDLLKKDKDATAVTIPGWVARAGARIAVDDEDIRYTEGYKDIVGGIKEIRLVVLSQDAMPTVEQINRMTTDIKETEGLEDYVVIRDGDARVWVMIKELNDKVKNLLVVTLEDNQLAMVHAKLNIPLQALEAANFEFNEKRNQQNNKS